MAGGGISFTLQTKCFQALAAPHKLPSFEQAHQYICGRKDLRTFSCIKVPSDPKSNVYSNILLNSFNKLEAIKTSVKIFQIHFEHFSSLAHIIC